MNSWSTIKELSTGKLITSTSIWIFLVPAITKMGNVTEEYMNSVFSISIVSSFSLLCLYFSAIAFFLSSMIYISMCPLIIKKFNSYSDFCKEGLSINFLNKTILKLNHKESEILFNKIKFNVIKASTSDIDSPNVDTMTISIGKEPKNYSFKSSDMPDVFWQVYDYHESSRVCGQSLCWVFFVIGFLLLGYLLISNLIIVIFEFCSYL